MLNSEQLQLLVNCWIVKINFNDDFKLSPTSLAHFIRRLRNNPIGTFVALMKLKVNLLDECLHVLIVVWLYVDRPLVSVSIFVALLPEGSRDVSIYNWFYFSYPLK